tara:strand:- start:373 stop:1497 length:1125 start_codon:yes stop_codon:yes gene_type:complete
MKHKQDNNPVNVAQYKDQIHLAALTGSSLHVLGQSGIGKTTIPVVLGNNKGVDVWVFNGSDKSPVEITGYGVPSETNKGKLIMKFSEAEMIPTLDKVGDKEVWWILDEWANWSPENRATFHSVVAPPDGQHRRLGTHTIGPNVKIIITSNRRQDGAAVGRFSIPEIARSTIVTLLPDPAAWWQWAEETPGFADTHVPSFIAFGASIGGKTTDRNHFCGDPVEFDAINPNPLPNPRSWVEVMKVLHHVNKGEVDSGTARVFVRGRVGDKAADALYGFLELMESLPSVGNMKANPDTFTVPAGTSDQFLLASAALVLSKVGVSDVHAGVHAGDFDWLLTGLSRLKPEVAAYGLSSATRRGINLEERDTKLYTNLLG